MIVIAHKLTLTCATCPAIAGTAEYESDEMGSAAGKYLDSVRQLRIAAHQQGWTFGGYSNTDYCPSCSKSHKE